MICKKCGANIPDGFAFCMQCGTKVENQKGSINSEENGGISEFLTSSKKQNSSRKRTYVVAAVSAALLILVVLGICFSGGDSNAKKGYFAGIPWGTDMETVQSKIEDNFNVFKIISEGNEISVMLYDYGNMDGVVAIGGFTFDSSKGLESVELFIGPTEDSPYYDNEFSNVMVDKYNKSFGVAVSSGDSLKKYTWEAEESIISISVMHENNVYLSVEKKK